LHDTDENSVKQVTSQQIHFSNTNNSQSRESLSSMNDFEQNQILIQDWNRLIYRRESKIIVVINIIASFPFVQESFWYLLLILPDLIPLIAIPWNHTCYNNRRTYLNNLYNTTLQVIKPHIYWFEKIKYPYRQLQIYRYLSIGQVIIKFVVLCFIDWNIWHFLFSLISIFLNVITGAIVWKFTSSVFQLSIQTNHDWN